MMIYVFGWFFFSFFLLLNSRRIKGKRAFFLIATFIYIYFLYGMRNINVGTDTEAYIKYITIYKKYSLRALLFNAYDFKRMEPGWILVSKIALLFTSNEIIVLKVFAVIYAILVIRFLSSLNDKEVYWVAFAYFGLYNICSGLNIMRQAIAMIIILYAYTKYREGSYIKMIILEILACMFHYGSILSIGILIPFSFVKTYTKNSMIMGWTIIAGTIIGCSVFPMIFQLLGISIYISDRATFGTTRFIIISTLFIVLCLTKRYYRIKNNLYNFYFLQTIMILLLVMNFMGIYSTVFVRLTSLLLPFTCFLPYALELSCLETKSKKIVEASIYILISTYFFHALINNIGGIVPFTLYK